MKKFLVSCLFIMAFLLFSNGCNNQNKIQTLNDDFLVDLSNVHIEKSQNSVVQHFDFNVISSKIISEFKIIPDNKNINIEYGYYLNENPKNLESVGLLYTDIDWAHAASLYKDHLELSFEEQYNSDYTIYLDEFESKLPNIVKQLKEVYQYQCSLNISSEDIKNEKLSSITISVNGKDKTIDLNNITYKQSPVEIFSEGFGNQTMAAADKNITMNKKGHIILGEGSLFEAEEDLILTDIYVADKNLEIDKINAYITTNTIEENISLNFPIHFELEKGQQLELQLEVFDAELKNKEMFIKNYNYFIDYSIKNNKYTTSYEELRRIKLDPQEMIASLLNDKSLMNYYDAFYEMQK